MAETFSGFVSPTRNLQTSKHQLDFDFFFLTSTNLERNEMYFKRGRREGRGKKKPKKEKL